LTKARRRAHTHSMKKIILDCGCHGVCEGGFVYSKIVQFSKKGVRGIQTKKTNEWKKLNGTTGQHGYIQVSIHGRLIRLNRLVALNFIKNNNAYPEVQHINGIKTDNRVDNLKWGNQKMNAADRDEHGNTQRGIKNKSAKLNDNQVVLIRKMIGSASLQKIADKFNVSKKLILLIKQNKIWKHLKSKG